MESSGVKWVRLGDYIEQCDERNTDLRYDIISVPLKWDELNN